MGNSASENNISNLIVFDFDDTLFPLTAFNENEVDCEFSDLSEPLQRMLRTIEISSIELLRTAQLNGAVKIVSCAPKDWVMIITKYYMPNLNRLLREKKVEVVSVYDQVPARIRDPIARKYIVFKDLLRQVSHSHGFKFVSVSNSNYEREAALCCTNLVAQENIRTIKFGEAPSFLQLNTSIEQLNSRLEGILKHRGFIDLEI